MSIQSRYVYYPIVLRVYLIMYDYPIMVHLSSQGMSIQSCYVYPIKV